jgi:maltose-binding protein MalE
MKKVIAIFAIVALTACGGASTEVKTDSATASTDSATQQNDTTYYKEINEKRKAELDSASK